VKKITKESKSFPNFLGKLYQNLTTARNPEPNQRKPLVVSTSKSVMPSAIFQYQLIHAARELAMVSDRQQAIAA